MLESTLFLVLEYPCLNVGVINHKCTYICIISFSSLVCSNKIKDSMLYIIHRRSIYYGKSIFILKSFMLSKYMPMNIPADPSWYCCSQYLYSSCYLITLSASQSDWFLPSCFWRWKYTCISMTSLKATGEAYATWPTNGSRRPATEKAIKNYYLFSLVSDIAKGQPVTLRVIFERQTNKITETTKVKLIMLRRQKCYSSST